MKPRYTTLAAVLLTATALTTTAAVTEAEVPTIAGSSIERDGSTNALHYRATLDGETVVVVLENGTFELGPDQRSVLVRNTSGTALDSLPLAYNLDGQQLPIRPQIAADGRMIQLVPELEAINRRALKPVASPLENQLAMNDLINAVSIGTSIGSLIGTAIGAALGVGIGFAVAGASCAVISVGCVIAVLPIVALVGGVGGLAGMVVAGGPTAGIALYNYVTTLQAAPGHSQYAQNLPGATDTQPLGTGAPR
ncbi:hypothetical protein [Nocardia aobensis]|uniref:hypothetical protein n=1 Tax=Nocardia aobensis TaxID=257277 RepID=UPI0012F6B8B1|nr:hypothetical protein [Nocardia aobensis]